MMRDANNLGHAGRRWRRLRRWSPLALSLLAFVLLAAACAEGSTGPAEASAGSSNSTGSSGDRREALLAYSQCMRDHGISDFPDPEPNGGIAIQAEPGSDLDLNNPRYQAADKACSSLLPPAPTAEQEEQARADMLKYAKCMREHGFPIPDPEPNGGIDIDAGAHPGLNPDNPKFQEANEVCGGPGEGDTVESTDGDAP